MLDSEETLNVEKTAPVSIEEACQHLEVTFFDNLQEGERQCVPCGQVVHWGN